MMFGPTIEVANSLRDWGVPAPDEVGFELESGEQAELVWFDNKICFLPDDLLDDRAAFEDAGWRVFDSLITPNEAKKMFGVADE